MRKVIRLRRVKPRSAAQLVLEAERRWMRDEIAAITVTIAQAEHDALPADLANLKAWQVDDLKLWRETLAFAIEGEIPPWHPALKIQALMRQDPASRNSDSLDRAPRLPLAIRRRA
jgi:hypothetical protein